MSETRRTVLRTRIDVLQKAGKSIGEGIGNFLQVFGCIMAERLTTQEMLMQRNSPPALSPVVQKPEEAQEPEVPTPPIPVTPVKVRAKRVNIGTKKFYHMGAPMPRPTKAGRTDELVGHYRVLDGSSLKVSRAGRMHTNSSKFVRLTFSDGRDEPYDISRYYFKTLVEQHAYTKVQGV